MAQQCHPQLRALFKTLDHCAIFLLIAGSYTPFLLVNMRGSTGWTLFVIGGSALHFSAVYYGVLPYTA